MDHRLRIWGLTYYDILKLQVISSVKSPEKYVTDSCIPIIGIFKMLTLGHVYYRYFAKKYPLQIQPNLSAPLRSRVFYANKI